MSTEQPTEKELLKTILEPLLEDFKYWFERSLSGLKSEQMPFFTDREQAQTIERIALALQQVQTSQMLFNATDGAAGIDSKMLLDWHQLVAECWSIAKRRREQS